MPRQSIDEILGSEVKMSIGEAIKMGTTLWRLMYAYEQDINKLPEHRQRASLDTAKELFEATFMHMQDVLYPHNIRMKAYEGRLYGPEYPLDPVNLGEFAPGEELQVQETLEPGFMCKTQRLRPAKVVLGRKSDGRRE